MSSQGDQVPIGVEGNDVPVVPVDMTSNGKIREALLALSRAMNTHVTRDIRPKMNALESIMNSRVIDFVRMNPSIVLVSKVGEDPQ